MTLLGVADLEYVASRLAARYESNGGDHEVQVARNPNVLESCVATQVQRFSGRPLYPSLLAKAGILFYALIKNQAFPKYNKRIAIAALFVFLSVNGKWMKVDTPELFSFALWVAQSPPDFKEQVLDATGMFVKKHLVDLDGNGPQRTGRRSDGAR